MPAPIAAVPHTHGAYRDDHFGSSSSGSYSGFGEDGRAASLEGDTAVDMWWPAKQPRGDAADDDLFAYLDSARSAELKTRQQEMARRRRKAVLRQRKPREAKSTLRPPLVSARLSQASVLAMEARALEEEQARHSEEIGRVRGKMRRGRSKRSVVENDLEASLRLSELRPSARERSRRLTSGEQRHSGAQDTNAALATDELRMSAQRSPPYFLDVDKSLLKPLPEVPFLGVVPPAPRTLRTPLRSFLPLKLTHSSARPPSTLRAAPSQHQAMGALTDGTASFARTRRQLPGSLRLHDWEAFSAQRFRAGGNRAGLATRRAVL